MQAELAERTSDPLKAQFHKLWGMAHDNNYQKPEWLKMMEMLDRHGWSLNVRVNEELMKRVTLAEPVRLREQVITIKKVTIREVDPATTVYTVDILDADGAGCWQETINSEEQLKWFLCGLKVATCMAGGTLLHHKVWKQGEENQVEWWP